MASTGLRPGSLVGGRFLVERFLRQGPSDRSYVCRDRAAGEARVVLRTLSGCQGAVELEELRHKWPLLSRIKHPHLAPPMEFGRVDHGGIPYLVRPFIDGGDIIEESARWSVEQILVQLVNICRVLHCLHARGIVHGHLKPSNVILARGQGGELEPKVVDFGLDGGTRAKRHDIASLAYTAPEVLLGHVRTPRADLYSLGILSYHVFTRRLPFDDQDEGYLIQKQLQGRADLRPVARLKGGSGLAQVVRGLLEKDPEKRPSSVEDVVRMLSAASGRDFSGSVSELKETYFSSGRFVGRDREMGMLQERALRVRSNGRGSTVFVVGESGAGKSRCMEELRTWALLEGWRIVEAECLEREDRAYGPYRRILARAELVTSAPEDAAGEDAIFRFEDVARQPEPPQPELSAGSAAGPFRDLLTRELVRLLSDRPTLLLLHDFHWADEATIAVLDYLTSDILAHPIFMVVSMRPGGAMQGPLGKLVDLAARQLRAESTPLEMLPPPVIEALIAGMTGEASLGREIGPWIHEASGGNPFFVEEILKHLVDRGLLRREMGKWRLAGDELAKLEVPSSVAMVLRHRLAQLSPGAVALTQWMAIFRRAVPKEQLRMLCMMESKDLEAGLNELISRQIIREVSLGGSFEFRHALISEVIVLDMPPTRRRRMHQRIAEALEQRLGDQENIQELAMHYTEGRCREKAIGYAIRAARACKAEFAHEPALRFYDYLLANKKHLSIEQACDVSIEAADTCCALGNPKRAIHILSRTIVGKDKRHSSLIYEIRRIVQIAISYQHLGNIRLLEKASKHGLGVIGPSDCPHQNALRASLLKQLAYCALIKSHSKDALSLLKLALDSLADNVELMLQGQIQSLISASQRVACNLMEAKSAALRSIEILQPIKALPITATAYSHLGIAQASLGRFIDARASHEQAISISKRTRSPLLRSQALSNFAECLCRSGKLNEADELAIISHDLIGEFSNPAIRYSAAATMAEIKLTMGDYGVAQKILGSLSSSIDNDIPVYSRAHVHFLCAWISYELGDYGRTLAFLDQMEGVATSEAPVYEGELGAILRSKIARHQGNSSEANDILQAIRTKLRKKRWSYHLCPVELSIGEYYLTINEPEFAAKHIQFGMKLACAMSCPHFQAHAILLRVSIRIVELQRENTQILDKICVDEINSELLKALHLAEYSHANELIWKIHAAIGRFAEIMGNWESSFEYSFKALNCFDALASRVPPNQLDSFCFHFDRQPIRLECQERIKQLRQRKLPNSFPIGDMQEEHVRELFRVSCVINAVRDLNELMDAIVSMLASLIEMDRALIVLKDDRSGDLSLARPWNHDAKSFGDLDSLSKQVLHDVDVSTRPFMTANATEDPRLADKKLDASQAGTIFCAPLTACGRTLGLIYADHKHPLESLDESTITLFAAFCNLAAVAIDNALAHRHLVQEKAELEEYLRQARGEYPELVGKSEAMQSLRERIALAAASPLDVLIWGESGTGKELVARALHRTGRRALNRFVPLDCGSLSDSLVESELFGYRKGAFTGAVENRVGLLEAADGGVIFLDEIANLSVRLQRKLLRVLQEREVRRIGETTARKINIQVIAATNKDLRKEIDNERFRNDLYFRLKAMEIRVPPVRERTGDVPLLLEYCLERVGRTEGGRMKAFSREARALLVAYRFPGNVRELKNIVEGSYYSTHGSIIDVEHLPTEVREGSGVGTMSEPDPAVWQIYRSIRDGHGGFDRLVKSPFLRRRIGSAQVRQVIHLALAEAEGRYRDAFRLLGLPEREYATMIQFLKRNDCYLDFRAYRKGQK